MKTFGIAAISVIAAFLSRANAGTLSGVALIDHHAQPLFSDANHPTPHDTIFPTLEYGGPIWLRLDGWASLDANSDPPSESAVALYLKYGSRPNQNVFSPAKVAAIKSHTSAAPGPIVRSIEMVYPGASARRKERILAKMGTRIGRRYSQRIVEEDIRKLGRDENLTRVRIFGTIFADGVKVIVALQPKSTPGHEYTDLNIGYEF
jgi:hypothetical protein